jgi:hypothetical protein
MTPHKCPYGMSHCTLDDPCAYCERRMLWALVKEMGKLLQDHPGLLTPCHANILISEILNRPLVKRITEAPE